MHRVPHAVYAKRDRAEFKLWDSEDHAPKASTAQHQQSSDRKEVELSRRFRVGGHKNAGTREL